MSQLGTDACCSGQDALVVITALAATHPEHQRGNSAPATSCECGTLMCNCQLSFGCSRNPLVTGFAVQQLLLKQVPGCHALKCEVLSELGRCQRYLARPKLEIQAYQRGLQICSTGQKSTERCDLLPQKSTDVLYSAQ